MHSCSYTTRRLCRMATTCVHARPFVAWVERVELFAPFHCFIYWCSRTARRCDGLQQFVCACAMSYISLSDNALCVFSVVQFPVLSHLVMRRVRHKVYQYLGSVLLGTAVPSYPCCCTCRLSFCFWFALQEKDCSLVTANLVGPIKFLHVRHVSCDVDGSCKRYSHHVVPRSYWREVLRDV